MRQELFKKEDYRNALREHVSILDCLEGARNCLQEGEFEKTLLFIKDINKSLDVLLKLAEKQKHEKEMKELLNRLVLAGIDVMVVKRHVQ
ncbi:hypothetical protein [Psychrobacillus vulpis]|uniref:Uncharacterized protein n=1 Tax=Psychrobacillus vulpis TaxID=2325572 RepID=A0A544TWJ3_9BACI|nr:hypothetical protein [Psychrobacillus vulpis]TQR21825.1 hypothetical protein FG384_02455 [Psychrobacillus vulpis]